MPGRAPTAGERWGAGPLTLLQAGLFSVAALMLPWTFDPVFSIGCLSFALASVAAGGSLLWGSRHALRVWRVQAFFGLATLAWLSALFISSGAYLAGLYGPLGLGLGVAIQLLLAPGLLFILPLAVWALAATGGLRGRAGPLVVVLGLGVLSNGSYWGASQSASAPAFDAPGWEEAIATSTSTSSVVLPLHRGDAFDCRESSEPVRALLAYRARFGERKTCLGADDLAALRSRVRELLSEHEALRPVKVDLIWRLDSISSSPKLATSFRLRAGRDGVCGGGRCLAPWQLMAVEAYSAYQPVPFIPDLRIGVDPARLRIELGLEPSDAAPWSGLSRARVESFVVGVDGELVRLDRFRPMEPSIDDREAVARAEAFLVASQRSDGRFHYLVDPFRGPKRTRAFSIARQAGTAFALCEWGTDRVRATAERALDHLTTFAVSAGDGAALVMPGATHARLGPTSLSLAAFGMCKRRFGLERFDPLMAKLTRFVVSLQDEATGRFAPAAALPSGSPSPGPHALYADGQAILASILMHELADEPGPIREAFARAELERVVRRAMDYTTGPYWPWPLRSFFFLEENWHCLAAKAALGSLRDERYESFCLDLVAWRGRLVQAGPQGDRGAYHFAHVSAPYTTPTAGFLEAGSAALEIAKARGEEAADLEAALERAMGFTVRAQWDETACFACTHRLPIVGAYSESLASTTVRVDFVQHAMAGLAGARHALELGSNPNLERPQLAP